MGWLKKLTKPISKVLDKIIPNEIKPALPYLSAFAPFMPGMQGIMGSTMLRRGLMSGALNLGSQLSQEGSEGEFDPLSLALASGIGAFSAPGTEVRTFHPSEGVIVTGEPSAAQFFEGKAAGMDDGLMKSGLKMLGKGSKYLTDASQTFQDNPFSKEGLKAAIVPASQGTADLAMISARQALDDYNAGLEEGSEAWYDDNARRVAIRSAMEAAGHVEDDILDALASLGLKDGGRVGYIHGGITHADGRRGFFKGAEADARAGKASMSPGTHHGGGTRHGGDGGNNQPTKGPTAKETKEIIQTIQDTKKDVFDKQLMDIIKMNMVGGQNYLPGLAPIDTMNNPTWNNQTQEFEYNMGNKLAEQLSLPGWGIYDKPGLPSGYPGTSGSLNKNTLVATADLGPAYHGTNYDYGLGMLNTPDTPEIVNYIGAQGGRVGRAGGGMMSVLPKGTEMDYRGGGMIPMGSKERADDVPARLSKNEFVMTADAVKAAGGGSVNRGAKRMYDLMHNLEARV